MHVGELSRVFEMVEEVLAHLSLLQRYAYEN